VRSQTLAPVVRLLILFAAFSLALWVHRKDGLDRRGWLLAALGAILTFILSALVAPYFRS
jgi:hypothetical protein